MTTVQELFDAVLEWQEKKARWIAIGETYRPLFESKETKELVRDSEAHKVIERGRKKLSEEEEKLMKIAEEIMVTDHDLLIKLRDA